MKISMILFLMTMILSWVSAETSQLIDQTEKNQSSSSSSQAAFQFTQGIVKRKEEEEEEGRREENEEEEAAAYRSRVGSIPPSCKHKCQGCNPCHPVQIPTTSATLPLQYANYEPEGWKCYCGSSFFNP